MCDLISGAVARHCNRSFNVAFKQKVIQFAESNTKAAATRAFNIDRKCVKTWIKQKNQIITMVGEVSGTNKKRKQ